jgi:group II intron reverse transcriptase/maturase
MNKNTEELAEPVEQRTLAARNSMPTAVTATQCAGQTLTGLDRVREAARRDKTLRFNNLLHHITPSLLNLAFHELNKNAASGVDKVTWRSYNSLDLTEKLSDLHDRVQNGRYKPRPSKRIWIEKDDGKQRPIGIASLEDKIVQQALVWVLQEIFEENFLGFSYGFRPKRNQHRALDAIYIAITCKKVSWILDADIKGFYDNIDHEWLMMFLGERVADTRVLDLCVKILRAGVEDEDGTHKTERGAAQGSVISPFFANVFLHFVLDLWVHQWRKRHSRGEVYIVRYADDVVIGLQYQSDGERLHRDLGHRLESFGLQLHEEKTKLIEFGRFAAANRQERGEGKPEVFNFLGLTHICSTTRSEGKFIVRRKTQKEKLHKKIKEVRQKLMFNRAYHIKEQIRWVRSVIIGHANYYGVPGNQHALSQFRKEVCRGWYRALRRRSDKAQKLTWIKMRKLIKAVIPSMRTVHPYPSQRFGV